ncbi:TPA: hypothetical protein NI805_006371 [Pseudomonas aeruginosa]|nr:hypothetical protein [Pseudomonas aeruginosa]
MNKANECTCPSGDGSLVHPCPAHPAVEQAGGDERAVDGKPRATKCPDCGEGDLMPGDLCACGYETDPAAGYACSECDGSGDGYVGEVCRECDGSGWFVTPEQARAALAQPSGEVVVTKNESGAIVSVTRQDKEGRVLSVIAESATLTAQAEKAEVERPEVVAWQYRVTAGPQTGWSLWHPGKGEEFERSYTVERRPLMTVAQHERIVGELRAVIAQLRQHKNDYMDAGQETYRALQNEIREREAEIARLDGLVSGRTAERDAALARVAELERKIRNEENAHTTTIEQRDNAEHWADQLAKAIAERFGVDIGEHSNLNCPWNEALVWMQQPPAQAQHSVPDGWVQSLPLKDHQPCKSNEDRANGYVIPIYSRPVPVEEALRKLRAVLCDPVGNVVIDGSDGDREEVQRALGKEGL